MSTADQIFEKVMKLSLNDLLILCSTAIETEMDKKRFDFLLLVLETRLKKRRVMDQMGIENKGVL